jgi:hypothetical protein
MEFLLNRTDDTDLIHKTYKQVKGSIDSGLNDVLIFKCKNKLAKFNLIYLGGDVQVKKFS